MLPTVFHSLLSLSRIVSHTLSMLERLYQLRCTSEHLHSDRASRNANIFRIASIGRFVNTFIVGSLETPKVISSDLALNRVIVHSLSSTGC